MNLDQFQATVDRLLKRHYAININDTPLHDREVAQSYLDAQEAPYQVVNDWVNECGLVRVDKTGLWGAPVKLDLTKSDQESVMRTFSMDNPLFGAPEKKSSPRMKM